jgi:predicted nucleotidyltransferase
MTVTEQQTLSDPVLRQFLELIEPLRERIDLLILFGSRARGDARPDSDYDWLVVLPQKDRQLIDRLYDAVVDVEMERGKVIALHIFTRAEYDHLRAIPTPFMRHVHQEGITLMHFAIGPSQ